MKKFFSLRILLIILISFCILIVSGNKLLNEWKASRDRYLKVRIFCNNDGWSLETWENNNPKNINIKDLKLSFSKTGGWSYLAHMYGNSQQVMLEGGGGWWIRGGALFLEFYAEEDFKTTALRYRDAIKEPIVVKVGNIDIKNDRLYFSEDPVVFELIKVIGKSCYKMIPEVETINDN